MVNEDVNFLKVKDFIAKDLENFVIVVQVLNLEIESSYKLIVKVGNKIIVLKVLIDYEEHEEISYLY